MPSGAWRGPGAQHLLVISGFNVSDGQLLKRRPCPPQRTVLPGERRQLAGAVRADRSSHHTASFTKTVMSGKRSSPELFRAFAGFGGSLSGVLQPDSAGE